MKVCPVCGFRHQDKEKRCIRCSAILDAQPSPEVEAFFKGRERRRRLGLPSTDLGLARLWGRIVGGLRIWEWFIHPLPQDVGPRNPWKAGFLSLIPGLGQLYNQQPKKAAFMVVGWGVTLAVALATFYKPFNHYLLGLAVLWMAYAFHDGLKTAVLINRQYWTIRHSLAAYFAWIFEVGLFFILAQYFSSMFLMKFRYMSEDHMAPIIAKGDRVAIDILSYKFRKPRVGEIVYYDPKTVKIVQGANAWIVDEFNAFERIVAGPGQTFECRGGRYYRDGVPVPDDQGPVVTREVYWDYKLTAPPDHYIVIFSYTGSEAWALEQAPRMNQAQQVEHWAEACLVAKDEIVGRAWFIYHPPPHRKFLRRPDSLPTVKRSAN